MKRLSKLGFWAVLSCIVVCMTATPCWSQGKGGGKGGGGGGAPTVRYDAHLLSPPPAMSDIFVYMMAKQSGEIIGQARAATSESFSIPFLRTTDGEWHLLAPPAQVTIAPEDSWSVHAISDSGRYLLFNHGEGNPLTFPITMPNNFWVWDRALDEWHCAIQWPERVSRPSSINDHGEFIFRGRRFEPTLGSLRYLSRFVSNAYLDGEPINPESPLVAQYIESMNTNSQTLNNFREYPQQVRNPVGSNQIYGARMVVTGNEVSGFQASIDRIMPTLHSSGGNITERSDGIDINQAGDVVGWSLVSANVRRAYVHKAGGQLVSVHPPSVGSSANSRAASISDLGWVLGTYQVGTYENHSFLSVPNFESTPLSLLIVGGDWVAYSATTSAYQVRWESFRSTVANNGVILEQRWSSGANWPTPFLLIPR